MNKLIMKEDEDILSFFRTLDHMVERLDGLSRNYRPMLNGERFLSDRELSERLKISRRTLQEYRNEGKLPYIQLGGKVLYKESDIERMLQNGHAALFVPSEMCMVNVYTAIIPIVPVNKRSGWECEKLK